MSFEQEAKEKKRLANSVDPRAALSVGSHNKDVKKWIDNYLGVGEWVMDQSVAVMGSSSWFERRR
ncbi:hypothetical protein N7478_010395 [Penicillium angulare]|uniref:uncharacterized protein n=1 Tax=Penicillium angulare TaxID=116970 RepID=UPI0025423923|nr:uncharacterized protein N7478_010395 [Penicillium angulare]KAJ5267587.1 hypothetical protein N7478_010395 [Penicillium angulare]